MGAQAMSYRSGGDLVLVAQPATASELAVTLSLLEAAGIPAFVSGGVATLYPSPLIGSYNTRRVLVPTACRDDADAALQPIRTPLPVRSDWRERLSVIVQYLLFGWFVPRYRRRDDDDESDDVADATAPLTRDERDP
jgi:hypothetical protein